MVYGGLALLGPLLSLAQRRWPAPEGRPPIFARRRWLDWSFWLITPLFTGVLTLGVGAWIAIGLASLGGHEVCTGAGLALRCSPWEAFVGAPARWPLPVQALLAFLLVDLLSYLSHRLRHRFAWRLHALHHSPTELDWLAAARLHPLDDLADNVAVMLPVLLLGFDPRLFFAIGPLLLLHTLYLHAAVDWDLGGAGRLLASPAFHRDHHRVGAEGNYGGVLSVWDHLFGTTLPEGRPRAPFGLDGGGR